jgi:hypothetical protein
LSLLRRRRQPRSERELDEFQIRPVKHAPSANGQSNTQNIPPAARSGDRGLRVGPGAMQDDQFVTTHLALYPVLLRPENEQCRQRSGLINISWLI